jgi:hypothetical protein
VEGQNRKRPFRAAWKYSKKRRKRGQQQTTTATETTATRMTTNAAEYRVKAARTV